jgi:hypothetical protein
MKNNIEKSSKLGNKSGGIESLISSCVQCGKEFVISKRVGPRNKYCSKQCREKHHHDVLKNRKIDRCCPTCGKNLNATHSTRKYCSKFCQMQDPNLISHKKRECTVCKKEFVSPIRSKQCCSCACARRKQIKTLKKLQLDTQMITAKCVECGETFYTQKLFGRNLYYGYRCPECRLVHERNRCRKRRMTTSQYKPKLNDFEVFERDNWICQICGEPVDKDRRSPDPLSPTIDHIKPLTKGGLHVLPNVRLAHHICNNRKNDQYREGYRYETWTCT